MAILDLGKIKLNYKGAFSNATTYEKDDVVSHNGSLWIAIKAATANSGKNFKAPGYRFKTNAYGPQTNDYKLASSFLVTKENVSGLGQRFYIDKVPTKSLTLTRGCKYRFHLQNSTMSSVDFQFCTSADGTTYSTGVVSYGTNGRDGYLEFTVPFDAPDTLYYKQVGTASIGGSATVTVVDGWEGYKYWESLSDGFSYKGTWSSATQYYHKDVVVRDGDLYIAQQDNLNKDPSYAVVNWVEGSTAATYGVGYWKVLSAGQRTRQSHNAALLMNKNPIGWPYKSTRYDDFTVYGNHKWIAKDGRVWSIGTGTSGSSGWHAQPAIYAMEVPLQSPHWMMSLDNSPTTEVTGLELQGEHSSSRSNADLGLLWGRYDRTTPHGERPKCIQITQGYDHCYYLLDNGQVLFNGYGSNGEGGYGTTNSITHPVPVLGLENSKIVKVQTSAGQQSSTHSVVAIDDEGFVWTWGYNAYGQLGTGDSNNKASAYRIPREYFNNERVIDVICTGTDYVHMVARTELNNLYAWGYNGVGQLGSGDTTDRWRPNKLAGWDPAANNGIIKMMVNGNAGNGRTYILDGNGFMWFTGYNGYYEGMTGDTTNRSTLTKSTQTPVAGNCTDFWACGPNGYGMIWCRTTDNSTYFVGYQSTYNGGTGDNATKSSPSLVPNITKLKEVYCVGSYSTSLSTTWLTEDGRIYGRGYENYAWNGNQNGAQSTSESNGSDYRPSLMGTPAGTKAVSIFFWSNAEGTTQFGPHLQMLTEDGRVWYSGATGRGNQSRQGMGGNRYEVWNSGQNNFTIVSAGR